METYTDFGVSYLIQTFVNKINTKLWNDCRVYLTGDFYYKVDQNRAILATLDSLTLRSRLNIFSWLIHRNIWMLNVIKTFKKMIHYNKYHSIFNIYSRHKKERIIPPSLLHSTNKKFVFYRSLFSTCELTGDHKFRERRYIIYTYKLNTYKLNNWLNLS